MEIQGRQCVFRFAKVFMCCSDWLIVSFLTAFSRSVVKQIIVVREFSGIVCVFSVQEYLTLYQCFMFYIGYT